MIQLSGVSWSLVIVDIFVLGFFISAVKVREISSCLVLVVGFLEGVVGDVLLNGFDCLGLAFALLTVFC
jgi:hypothetical protein